MMRTGHIRRMLAVSLGVLALGPVRTVSEESRAPEQPTSHAIEPHLGKGYDALKQDRYDEAVNEFRAALSLDSTLTLRARFPLAVALFEMKKFDEARHELETVRQEVGDHPNVLYYFGRVDLEQRNFQSAIQNLSAAAAKPPFPDTAYFLGYAYFKQGNLTAAEKWLKEAVQANPRDARIAYQLGLVYRKQGRDVDAQKALALSDELRQRDDKQSRLRLECAQKLDEGGRDEARTVCEQLYDPNDAEKLTELGTIYGQHGDPEAALKPLQRAAELTPQSPQMQYNLAMAYFQLGRFAEARAPLSSVVQRWPDLFPVNALYGTVLSKLGEDVAAYQALGRAHQLNPEDSGTTDLLYTTTVELARKSQRTHKYSDSLRYFAEASKLRPRESEPHRGMAEIFKLTGRQAQALAQQREADLLDRNPAKPD
jgi:protein O-GlcNAc transferase